jgi:glycosyltransferase involved in cell wall biosynthesis
MKKIGLSIIIPLYNAKDWIVPTIEHVANALQDTNFDAEIIVIDDGSTDGGAEIARTAKLAKKCHLTVVSQENTGRYLARKHGVELSKKENILFIDSRVYIDQGSLRFLESQLMKDSNQLWNGHVNIDKKGNLFARFWDAVVCIAWRRYFRSPKTTSYGLKDFDYYPKGTGFFYVPKVRLLAAMRFFEKNTNDLRFSSDDTLLIRYMIKYQNIHLSPEFSCLYHGRSNLNSFLKHGYVRGQFFIDGFLRRGTRYFVPLLGILLTSLLILISVFIWPVTVLSLLVGLLVLFVLGLFFGALFFGIVLADALSLALLGAPFAVVYMAGLWRGIFRKFNNKSE